MGSDADLVLLSQVYGIKAATCDCAGIFAVAEKLPFCMAIADASDDFSSVSRPDRAIASRSAPDTRVSRLLIPLNYDSI